MAREQGKGELEKRRTVYELISPLHLPLTITHMRRRDYRRLYFPTYKKEAGALGLLTMPNCSTIRSLTCIVHSVKSPPTIGLLECWGVSVQIVHHHEPT